MQMFLYKLVSNSVIKAVLASVLQIIINWPVMVVRSAIQEGANYAYSWQYLSEQLMLLPFYFIGFAFVFRHAGTYKSVVWRITALAAILLLIPVMLSFADGLPSPMIIVWYMKDFGFYWISLNITAYLVWHYSNILQEYRKLSGS